MPLSWHTYSWRETTALQIVQWKIFCGAFAAMTLIFSLQRHICAYSDPGHSDPGHSDPGYSDSLLTVTFLANPTFLKSVTVSTSLLTVTLCPGPDGVTVSK